MKSYLRRFALPALALLFTLAGCNKKSGGDGGAIAVSIRMPAGLYEISAPDAIRETLTAGPFPGTRWDYNRLASAYFFCPGGMLDSILLAYKEGKLQGYMPSDITKPKPYNTFQAEELAWMGEGTPVQGALQGYVDWAGEVEQTETKPDFHAELLTLSLADVNGPRRPQEIVSFKVEDLQKQFSTGDFASFWQRLGQLKWLGFPLKVAGKQFTELSTSLIAAQRLIYGPWQDLQLGLAPDPDEADSLLSLLPRYWFLEGGMRDTVAMRFVVWNEPIPALSAEITSLETKVSPEAKAAADTRFATRALGDDMVAAVLESYRLGMLSPLSAKDGKPISYVNFVKEVNAFLADNGSDAPISAQTSWNIKTPGLSLFTHSAQLLAHPEGASIVYDYLELQAMVPDSHMPVPPGFQFPWAETKALLESRYRISPDALPEAAYLAYYNDPEYPICNTIAQPSLGLSFLKLHDFRQSPGTYAPVLYQYDATLIDNLNDTQRKAIESELQRRTSPQ